MTKFNFSPKYEYLLIIQTGQTNVYTGIFLGRGHIFNRLLKEKKKKISTAVSHGNT